MRHPLAGERALREPAERTPVLVDQQRELEVAVAHLRADRLDALADAHQRRLPEVDVAHALERQALERAVGADEVLDERVRRVHQELGRRRELRQVPALLHDGDPVAHLDRLVDVVRDEDDRLADLALEAQELVLQAFAVDRVDRPERLVHQHQRRVDGERTRHADPLALPPGELGRVAITRLRGVERDELEQLVDATGDPRLVPAEQARDGRDVLADGQMGEEPDLLDRVADLAAQLGRPALPDAAPVEQDVAVRDLDHPVDHPHRGRLPAARGTDEDADLARRNRQREVLDGRLGGTGVALGDAAEFECRGGGHRAPGDHIQVLWWERPAPSSADSIHGRTPRGAMTRAPGCRSWEAKTAL